jgi:hypothetical protein
VILACLLTVAVLVLAIPGGGRAAEVTISFDDVSVSGLEVEILTNRSIHQLYSAEPDEPLGGTLPPDRLTPDKPGKTAPKGADKVPDKGGASAKTPPKDTDPRPPIRLGRLPGAAIPAPGAGMFNPSFVENGFLVEAFWAIDTGLPGGRFIRGHFHPKNLDAGFEGQHFGGPRELHGIFIKATDGRQFTVKSLKYRVTRNRELGRAQSIAGFANFDVKVLIATEFAPKQSVLGQFIAFSVGPPLSNDLALPFAALPIGGFEDVTQVFIASSASVDLDDIVLEVE